MPAVRKQYQVIDLRAKETVWPETVPEMTGPEAIRAARRLWRFAMGETLTKPIVLTTGNRYTWTHRGELRVNPTRGWRHFIHDLSHLFVYLASPGEKPHSKFHARFELKLIREVLRRGWLDGKLRDKVIAAETQSAPSPSDRYRDTLTKIDAATLRWDRKALRAKRALAKLQRRRRYYERAIEKGQA